MKLGNVSVPRSRLHWKIIIVDLHSVKEIVLSHDIINADTDAELIILHGDKLMSPNDLQA